MTLLQGYWFDGKTSAGIAAEVLVDGSGMVSALQSSDKSLLHSCDFSQIRISSRLGNTPRYLYFASGEKFETRDNQEIDQLLQQYRPSLFNTLAYQLESHIYFVCLTLVTVVALSWVLGKYGLPAASKAIAYRLPQEVMNRASLETLKLLDKTHLEPTRLPQQHQARLLAHFAPALQKNADLHLNIVFREGGKIGANAFALPDGTILFTDEMVKLAHSDDELLSVLAHEIGHVKYRHSLRSAIQGTSIGFLASMLTGDLSAASGALTALPVILTTMSYSRDFEREADQHALDYLTAEHIDPVNFVTLMERVSYEAHCDRLLKLSEIMQGNSKEKNKDDAEGDAEEENNKSDKQSKDSLAGKKEIVSEAEDPLLAQERSAERKLQCDKLIGENKSDKTEVMDYFSTHPATAERLQKFRQAH